MGFWDFLTGKKPKNKQKQDSSYWETHCENCGELLEDCECDDKELSLEDISLMDMIDEDDELDEAEEIEKFVEEDDADDDFDDFE